MGRVPDEDGDIVSGDVYVVDLDRRFLQMGRAVGAVMPAGIEGVPTPGFDFERHRAEEFSRLDREGIVYLDFTGSGLAPASSIRRDAERLLGHCWGNPHSPSAPSRRATAAMERARERVLEFFSGDPDEWIVVFTANASGALRLVGEAFPFGPERPFVLLSDDHNSVHGIREYAARTGAPPHTLPLDSALGADLEAWQSALDELPPGLLAYPLQSNFSGVRHLDVPVRAAREAGWRVLLDVAASVPTHRLDLRTVEADYLAVSFYKMFGYPTGVGALLARRDALEELRRPAFFGGTVDWVTTLARRHSLLPGPEGFEDGTPHFQAFGAVVDGLDWLDGIGMDRIERRIRDLREQVEDRLLERTDGPGLRTRIYGPAGSEESRDRPRGATLSFNLVDDEGRAVHCERIEQVLGREGIAIRAGCFCNPGAAETAFGYGIDLVRRCLEGRTGLIDLEELAECAGKPAGALRISLGVPTVQADLDRFFDALDRVREGWEGEGGGELTAAQKGSVDQR